MTGPQQGGGTLSARTGLRLGRERHADLDRAIVAIIQRHVYVAGGGSAEVALGRAT